MQEVEHRTSDTPEQPSDTPPTWSGEWRNQTPLAKFSVIALGAVSIIAIVADLVFGAPREMVGLVLHLGMASFFLLSAINMLLLKRRGAAVIAFLIFISYIVIEYLIWH